MSHSELMAWYYAERNHQVRMRETVEHMDDGIHPITFKEFLIMLAKERRQCEPA